MRRGGYVLQGRVDGRQARPGRVAVPEEGRARVEGVDRVCRVEVGTGGPEDARRRLGNVRLEARQVALGYVVEGERQLYAVDGFVPERPG